MDPKLLKDGELDTKLQERFKQLPKVVQDAITSADVEKRMRTLADTQKLHLDQWEALENEVMLALLGFQPVEDLEKNIKSEVNVSDEVATMLASEVSKIVFEPIREELERELAHRALRRHLPRLLSCPLPRRHPQTRQKPCVRPQRKHIKPGEPSTERKVVHDDPYREPPA